MRDRFSGLAVGWAVVFSALAASAAPPPELGVPEWADAFRHIAPESGARIIGEWRTAVAPYMRRPMQVSGVDHPAASAWLRWSAKTGKTQVFLNAVGHCIDTAPRSIMVVCATDQKQKDFEREIFTPAVRVTPRLALKVLPTRSRSGEGSTTYHKRFRGGFLKIVNGGSEGQLQQSDIGLLVFEEPSSYANDVGGRGSPVEQARSRQIAWGDDAKEIGGGTPKLIGDCIVTEEVERRTCEKFYVPCPHCGVRQLLIWENMVRSLGRPYFVCGGPDAARNGTPGCGTLIGHEHKRAMVAQGEWLACFEVRLADGTPDPETDNPVPPPAIAPEDWAAWAQVRGPDIGTRLEGRDPSFDGIWQAYSPFATWEAIFKAYDAAVASGDPEKLVTFWQQVLGRPFEAVYERPATTLLFEHRARAARVAELQRGEIPPWAWTLFGTADLQGDRIEWAVYAVGPGPGPEGAAGRRYARIDVGVIPISPVDPRAWAELADVTRRTYEGPNCRRIGFDRFGIDTGGHHTSQAYAFCSGRPGVLALKGKPNDRDGLPLERGTERRARIGGRVVGVVQLYLVGTHKLKKDVYHGLAQTLAGVEQGQHLAGSITLPEDATEADFEQITAEVLLPADRSRGRRDETWDLPKGKRNEQLDLAVYALALAWSFLPYHTSQADWDRLLEGRRRDPTEAAALPLERVWNGPAEAPPERPSEAPKTEQPPAPANGVRQALMRLAALNRGDDE